MNGKERNAEVRKIFQDMPVSIPLMERYKIIARVAMSEESSARSWISDDDKRFIPAIKLQAIKEAARKYGNGLLKPKRSASTSNPR